MEARVHVSLNTPMQESQCRIIQLQGPHLVFSLGPFVGSCLSWSGLIADGTSPSGAIRLAISNLGKQLDCESFNVLLFEARGSSGQKSTGAACVMRARRGLAGGAVLKASSMLEASTFVPIRNWSLMIRPARGNHGRQYWHSPFHTCLRT